MMFRVPLLSLALALVQAQSDYGQPYRPQFHFSPPQQWMNDPNGLVYYEGEYHMFYQYHPDSTVWGPMHWGHAISSDLVHWDHLPIALYPDDLGYIFSGSAVVDVNNTSGFGGPGQVPLVAIFTYHDPVGESSGRDDYQSQALAFSLDQGRTWTKWSGNPALPNPGDKRDFRDPHVFWHDLTSSWIMVLAEGSEIGLYKSPDLKSWSGLSKFGVGQGNHEGVWECPDLFPLADKWVMLVSNGASGSRGSATQYFIGNFDGHQFVNDNDAGLTLWLDTGKDNYAGVTWFGVSDQRRLFLGWMSNWNYADRVPTLEWRGAMTLPRELELVLVPGVGLRLGQRPVLEMSQLCSESLAIPPATVDGAVDWNDKLIGDGTLLNFKLNLSNSANWKLIFSNPAQEKLEIGYDQDQNEFFIDRTKANADFDPNFPSKETNSRLKSQELITLDLWMDRASAEVFADNGMSVMTDIFFPTLAYDTLILETGSGITVSGHVCGLDGIWTS